MMFRVRIYNERYGVYKTNSRGRFVGGPLELYARYQDAARRVQELIEEQAAEARTSKRSKRKES